MQEGRTLLQKGGLEIHIHFSSSHLSQIFCWAQYPLRASLVIVVTMARSRSRSRSPIVAMQKKIAMTERVATQKFVTTFYRRSVCAACSGDLGQPVCFALSSKWAKNRCSFHAKQVGCHPPPKERRVCAAFNGDLGQKKCFATGGKWSNGMCCHHARKLGYRRPQKKKPCSRNSVKVRYAVLMPTSTDPTKKSLRVRVATEKPVTTFYRRRVCAAFSGHPGKKKCFAQSHKWHNGMCVFHARQVGCQPPQKEPVPAEIILRAAGASKDLVDAMGESEEEAVKVKKDDQDSS